MCVRKLNRRWAFFNIRSGLNSVHVNKQQFDLFLSSFQTRFDSGIAMSTPPPPSREVSWDNTQQNLDSINSRNNPSLPHTMENSANYNPVAAVSMFPDDMDEGTNPWHPPPESVQDYSLPSPYTGSIAPVHSQGPSLSGPGQDNWGQASYGHQSMPDDVLGAVGGAPEPRSHSNRSPSKSNPRYNSGDSYKSNIHGNPNGPNPSQSINPSYPYPSNSSVDGTRGSIASFPDSQDFDAVSHPTADPVGAEKAYRSAPEARGGYHSYPEGTHPAYPNGPAYPNASGASGPAHPSGAGGAPYPSDAYSSSGAGGFIPPHGSDSFSVSVPSSYGQALSQIDSGHQGQEDPDSSWIAPDDVRNYMLHMFHYFSFLFFFNFFSFFFSSLTHMTVCANVKVVIN